MEALRAKKTIGAWTIAVIVIFVVMATSIYGIAKKTYDDMSEAAIQNLNENLSLMGNTVEAIMRSEAEFQLLTAEEIAQSKDPQGYIRNLRTNDSASKFSFVPRDQEQGVSNDGEVFDPSTLVFPEGSSVSGLGLSQTYVNYQGVWAYTMKCPVESSGQSVGTLYIEYDFGAIEQSLPKGFYDKQAVLYLMDTASERFVMKPEGMGERDAGHLNLEDFYRANRIDDAATLAMVEEGIAKKENIMFSHRVKGQDSLCYLWALNGGTVYLVGYVPMSAIQKEAQSVNVAIMLVIVITLAAFFLCVAIYAYNRHKQRQVDLAREAERALHNKQLAKALQAAEVANESKSAFLANMSHDIRTPMNAVLGFASILAREADNPAKVRDCANKIMASGRHLLDLINDVLDISKIESGKATLNLEEFNLGDSLVAVESIIAPMAHEKDQNFITEITNVNHERLIGDETHLNQILINLLSNAVKYTQEGGTVCLRFVGLAQHSNQFERIRIEVEDNGYGMSPEFLETIFDSFTRAENSTTNKVQGTGLGMSITKSLVELMGGTIEVESEEGKGTLFRVDLELRIPEEQAQGFFWAQQGIGRILGISCSERGRDAAVRLLEGTGVVVDTAADMHEAEALVQEAGNENGYQLLMYKPGKLDQAAIDEAESLRVIINPLDGPAVPVLYVLDNGFDRDEQVELPSRSGVLVHPFFLSTLKQAIEGISGVSSTEVSDHDTVLEGKHFLAAEDNLMNASILEELLDMEGATVEIVENGQLCVERFEACEPGEFDAILMDVQMPVMNGHDASRAIRSLSRPDAKEIPIFAMTADAFVEDEKAALAAGMNAHVAKPIEVSELKRAVDQFVEKGLS